MKLRGLDPAALEAGLLQLKDPRHTKAAQRLLAAVIPTIATQLEPHLPPAAPEVRRVQTVQDNGTATTRTTRVPAMPPPAVQAREIAKRLAPYVVAEHLVGTVTKAQAAHAAAAPAAAAVARHLSARVSELEGKL